MLRISSQTLFEKLAETPRHARRSGIGLQHGKCLHFHVQESVGNYPNGLLQNRCKGQVERSVRQAAKQKPAASRRTLVPPKPRLTRNYSGPEVRFLEASRVPQSCDSGTPANGSSSLSYLIFGNCCLDRVLERLIEITCVLPAERPASMILELHSREF